MTSPDGPTQRQVLADRSSRVPWRRALREAWRDRSGNGAAALPERLEGAVYGHLVGDALGVPYEFGPPRPAAEVAWRGGGAHGQPPGTWSDDGALMLALLDSLLSAGYDPADQGRRALAWREEGRYAPGGRVFDIGGATAAALSRIAAGTPAAEAGAADAKGNGSLMRILPLPLVMREAGPGELADLAARVSRVTHGSAEAQVACALYALVARRLLGGERDPRRALRGATAELRDALAARGLLGSPEAAEPAAALAALDAFLAWPGRAGSGRVVDSFWSAWDAFAGAATFQEAVTRAIALGGDTDTTGAIAGGLAGLRWRVSAVPPAWRWGLRDRHLVRPLVDRLVETDTSPWDGRPWETSTSSPLRVDRLDLAGVGAPTGTAGITFLPGKRYVGYHTGAHWRDLETDASRLRDLGVDLMLLLVEDRELRRCRVADIREVLIGHGVDLVRFPIRDPLLPRDGGAFRATIASLLRRVREGAFLAIACRGGLDRSGLAAACLLREAGLAADEAIARVQAARRGALTLPDQQAYVRAWPPSR
jgi:ADP-ribosylglycohydrolase